MSPPHMGGEEIKFVQEAFESNWIAPVGPHIGAFEQELVGYTGSRYCAALSSGTAAIHLALIVLGVQRDDEVICATFTFAGSCNPIVYLGAQPVFVDSETTTWNMDPELLEEAVRDRIRKKGKKPKAIIVVHLYGTPANMDRIMEVANRYEIPVIEDAAEALGSGYHGKKAGSIGHIGVFSFNGNKIITTSGGGALVSENQKWIEKARFLATQARDPAPHYEHSEIGFNYRMSNVCAAIGRGQLTVLDDRVRKRRAIFDIYRKELMTLFTFSTPEEGAGFSNRWLSVFSIKSTDNQNINLENIRQILEIENIESRPLWKPMHLQPVYRNATAYTNSVSEKLFKSGICLPSGSSMADGDVKRVVEVLKTGLQKQGR